MSPNPAISMLLTGPASKAATMIVPNTCRAGPKRHWFADASVGVTISGRSSGHGPSPAEVEGEGGLG